METSRDDVSIAIRSAFLQKGTQQRFSLFVLVIVSLAFLFIEKLDNKPLNYLRSLVKDAVYRTSVVASLPLDGSSYIIKGAKNHFNLKSNYEKLKLEHDALKRKALDSDFLLLENTQLKKLVAEEENIEDDIASSRVLLDKQSPYINSFIINSGTNKKIKKGMAVLHGNNFIGRIVDVNFFSSRILLVNDLNSKIPVITEPSGEHAILSGHGGQNNPSLEYLPINYNLKTGDKVYTSGKEGIFAPGIPIGSIEKINDKVNVALFSDLNQVTFVNVVLSNSNKN
tara:strand:- start:6344 stop:7192 length:849 start_codon:yes stop_codon:yes gene_type:complete